MEERRILGVLLRRAVPDPLLFDGIAQALGVRPDAVKRLDEAESAPAAVLVERYGHERGFELDLTVYVSPHVQSVGTEVDFALKLSKALGQDILASPPSAIAGANPYQWLLVKPNGEIYQVWQQADQDDQDVVIDESKPREFLRPGAVSPRQ